MREDHSSLEGMIFWYNKRCIFGLRPGSRHRAPKTFDISWVIGMRGVSFVIHSKSLSTKPEFMLMKWLGVWGSLPED